MAPDRGACEGEQRHAPRDDEEGDSDGLRGESKEEGAQHIVGQQGDGPRQNLPGHGVVNERPAGLGAADPGGYREYIFFSTD